MCKWPLEKLAATHAVNCLLIASHRSGWINAANLRLFFFEQTRGLPDVAAVCQRSFCWALAKIV